MKKTGSIAAAMLVALSLVACSSSDDEASTSSTAAAQSSSSAAESSSRTAVAKAPSEAPSESANPNIPRKCELLFALLEVGDVVKGDDLWLCTQAAHAQLSSLRLEETTLTLGEEPFHLEGQAARTARGFDLDVNSTGTTLRGIDGRYWIKWAEGDGWKEYTVDDRALDRLLRDVDLEKVFNSGGDTTLQTNFELTASKLPDERWKFEHVEAGTGYLTWFIIDQDYRLTESGFKSAIVDSTRRFSAFNEPVSIEPPM